MLAIRFSVRFCELSTLMVNWKQIWLVICCIVIHIFDVIIWAKVNKGDEVKQYVEHSGAI